MLVKNGYIKRHKMGFVFCHWLNACSFLMLFLTALPLYTDTFRPLYDMFGPNTLQTAHRFFGVLFIATPFLGFVFAREGYGQMLRSVLSFGKDDIEFNQKFPLELIGKDPKMPKQGFYNGGEKLSICLQVSLWCVLVISGLILWQGSGVVDNSLRAWMIPIHSIAAGIAFAGAIGHIYLAMGVNPDSVQGMKDGTVKAAYAVHHHGKWVDELVAKGKVTREEIDKAMKMKA